MCCCCCCCCCCCGCCCTTGTTGGNVEPLSSCVRAIMQRQNRSSRVVKQNWTMSGGSTYGTNIDRLTRSKRQRTSECVAADTIDRRTTNPPLRSSYDKKPRARVLDKLTNTESKQIALPMPQAARTLPAQGKIINHRLPRRRFRFRQLLDRRVGHSNRARNS
jgi:hypothetical protein